MIANDSSASARAENTVDLTTLFATLSAGRADEPVRYVFDGASGKYYCEPGTQLILAPPPGTNHSSLKADFAGLTLVDANVKVGDSGREMVHTSVDNLYLGGGELWVHQCDHSTFRRCVVGRVRCDGPSLYGLAFEDILANEVHFHLVNHFRWVGGKVQQGQGMTLDHCAVGSVNNVDFSFCASPLVAMNCGNLSVNNCYFEKSGSGDPGNHDTLIRLEDCTSPVVRDCSLNAANGSANDGTHTGYAVHAIGCRNLLIEGCSTQWALHSSFRFDDCIDPEFLNCYESGREGWDVPLRVEYRPTLELSSRLEVPALCHWVEEGGAQLQHDGMTLRMPNPGVSKIRSPWVHHAGGRLRFSFAARLIELIGDTRTTYTTALRVFVQQKTGVAYPLGTTVHQLGPSGHTYIIEGDAPENEYQVTIECRTSQEPFVAELMV